MITGTVSWGLQLYVKINQRLSLVAGTQGTLLWGDRGIASGGRTFLGLSSPRPALPSPRFAAGRDGLLLALGPDQWLEFLLHLCLGPSPLCIPSLSVLTPRRLMEVKKHRFQKCCSRSQLTSGSNSGQYLQHMLILKGKEVKGAPRSGGLCPVPEL